MPRAQEMATAAKLAPLPEPGIDLMAAPPWWLTRPEEIRRFLESLPGVEVEEIGKTAGGRTIIAASYGPREMLPGRTAASLAAAAASGSTAAFYGQGQRIHPVLLFLGAAHGTEVEGTVAALNYLNIIVTGKDLLGRPQPEMAEHGRQLRFIVIPLLNVDGRERAAHARHFINASPAYFEMITQGLSTSGEVLTWGANKAYFPQPPRKILGTYFNDAGVNLVYDCQMGPDMQPENAALIRYCRRELPDCILMSHSNNGSLVMAPSGLMGPAWQAKVLAIGAAVGTACRRRGYAKFGIPNNSGGTMLYQSDALYHACGALPVLVEFPEGWLNIPDNHTDILDIGLTVIDESAAFGIDRQFRPRQ